MIRLPRNRFSNEKFQAALSSLSSTQYSLGAKGTQAPKVTNCVTSIRFLLEKSSENFLPPVFIGDMPRTLVFCCGAMIQRVKICEIERGDLIFLRRKVDRQMIPGEQYITHIAMGLAPSTLYHSSFKRGGSSIENLIMPQDSYGKKLVARAVDDPACLIRYIDPRNKRLKGDLTIEVCPTRRALSEGSKNTHGDEDSPA